MLAYEVHGVGVPVVFLHGLTFDRRMWRPIVERLGGSVRSILIDLPAHGESTGTPAPLEQIADEIHGVLDSLGVARPVLVGHSMSVALAFLYASVHGAAGIVAVDQGLDVRPFAELVSRLEPQLRGDSFTLAWQAFEDSLGLDHLPEPQRSLARLRDASGATRGRRGLLGATHARRSGAVPGRSRRAAGEVERAVPRRVRASPD